MDLVQLTAELIEIPSVSHHEAPLVDHLERRLRAHEHLSVDRVGDNLVARTQFGRPVRLGLVGHSDTVPPNGNERALVEGDRVSGLGACDMKGGLAAYLAVIEAATSPAIDLTLIIYAGEEVAAEHNGLGQLFQQRPDLLGVDAAVLGEPSSAEIEAGCQGTLRLRASWLGERAHTARPWMGRNAIHRLGPVLDRIAARAERRPVIDGCEFREALQVVAVEGGVAGNVVPDRATLVVNHRFAPDRRSEQAVASALATLADPDEWEITDLANAAPPGLSHPVLAALRDRNQLAVRAKLGWTDVARFAARGIPAVNFGPGHAHLAHTAGEWTDRVMLERVYRALHRLVSEGANNITGDEAR